jgi:dUTPase
MRIQIHLPRQSEAEIEPTIRSDITVKPKFYKKMGLVPVFYFTTIDKKNREERHVLMINAASKRMTVEKLVEVVPICDEREPKDATADGPADNETAED